MTKFYGFVTLVVCMIFMSLASVMNAAVYLIPGDCAQGNEEWWAYTWTNGIPNDKGEVTKATEFWTQGTVGSDGKVTFDLTDKGYNLIFVRMNPDRNGNGPSFEYRWNQTADLTLMEGSTYELTGFGEGYLMNGQWQKVASVTNKTIWQQTNAEAANFLSHRRALTGRHCMVNKLVSVVEAANWVKGLDNMTDEDLTNDAVFPSVASVGVGAKPITSIRDTENHYAEGTTAGFTIVASSGASVLKLGVANAWAINFYLEGKLKATKAVSSGQKVGGVGLTLIQLPGSKDVTIDLSATAPCEFDEISLSPVGIADASVITNTRIKYAFVGDYKTNTITQTSMKNYAAAKGRMPFSLDQGKRQRDGKSGLDLSTEGGYWAGSDLIDDDLSNGVAWGVISIGSSLDCRVGAVINRADPDQSMPFKAGSSVGFKISSASLLKLPVGEAATIQLYKGEWKEVKPLVGKSYYEYVQTEVQKETIDGSVLSLKLISGDVQFPTITAKEDFSHVRITFLTGLKLDLGGTKALYAFISDPAETTHQCNLGLSANASVCSTDTEYQLTSAMPVKWEITEQPAGANATIDENGKITGMPTHIDGNYVIKATANDGCTGFVTITHGLDLSTESCDNPIYNEIDKNDWALSEQVHDKGGSLITIGGSKMQDSENILSKSLEDYALYTQILNTHVVENMPIVGVRKTEGLISDGTSAHRIGFVIEAQSTGLTADVIDLFNIRTYYQGEQTDSKVIKETNSLKVKLIGSRRAQKLRFAVDIPAGVQFDEFVLWKSGVLDLSIDKMKIYYAFDEPFADEEAPSECFDPIGCASTVISNLSGARIKANDMQFAGAVNVANVVDNLTFLVDDDINTALTLTNTVSLGDGLVVAVDLGRVYPKTQQVGLIMDSKTYLAGVKLGSWITIKTYLNGVEKDKQTDWSVLGVNAIGYGDKSYIFFNPTSEFDEVRITIANIANLLEFNSKYYGLFIRNDYDGDGTPDCKDDDSCAEEYTLDEEATELRKPKDYIEGNLVLHRSFEINNWNCITLPVDLTWLQVRNAFGNGVRIATPEGFYYSPYIGADGTKYSVLYYNPRTDKDGDIALEKNKYYVILPEREPDLADGTYIAQDGITMNAPIYFIPKVTYLREAELAGGVVEPMTVNYKKFNNGSNAPMMMADENTNEVPQIILHGSQVYLDGHVNSNVARDNYLYSYNNKFTRVSDINGAPMRGFRFYAENRTPYPISHERGTDLDTPTGIVNIVSPAKMPEGVYTIDGRMIRTTNDTTNLPTGFYIVGGKKVVVSAK